MGTLAESWQYQCEYPKAPSLYTPNPSARALAIPLLDVGYIIGFKSTSNIVLNNDTITSNPGQAHHPFGCYNFISNACRGQKGPEPPIPTPGFRPTLYDNGNGFRSIENEGGQPAAIWRHGFPETRGSVWHFLGLSARIRGGLCGARCLRHSDPRGNGVATWDPNHEPAMV